MIRGKVIEKDLLLGEVCSLLLDGIKVKIRPKGNSMRPFIRENMDEIVLAPPVNIRKGDVVLARIDGKRFVVHRIIKIVGNQFFLMGDGNLFGYEKCSEENIFGVAECIIRNGQRLSLKSFMSRSMAFGWRLCLPLRRIVWKYKFNK